MKRLLAMMLLMALAVSCAFAEGAAAPGPEGSALEFDVPVNELTEDFEEAGGEGEVLPLEAREAAHESDALPAGVEFFAPDDLEKCIIGTDDRVRVKNTKQYPYCAIANMKVTGTCKCKWECTGFMVGKKWLMTAAHCMVCAEHGKWAKNVTFYFGYQNSKNYLYKYTGKWTAWAGTLFPNGYSAGMEDDYCFVRLEKNVGDKTGWFGMSFPSEIELNGSRYTVAGYRSNALKYSRGTAAALSGKLMTYTADDKPGNSGGPIFTSDYYAVGIIAAENNVRKVNYGRRLTRSIYDEMLDAGY